MTKRIYVAATSQHVGKTTSTLGLVVALKKAGLRVGYCKPVGQQFVDLGNLRVDKDALLFSTVMNFDLQPHYHSPVILGKGATTSYLDAPTLFDYKNDIIKAANWFEQEHELVIFEGTGHPGVGSVVGLSNAVVAKMLNAGVIMLVEGGIGNTIDRLHMSLSLFREQKVPIIGVIINKVIPDKIDKIRHYVGTWLKQNNLPLLGILPFDQSLSYPIMSTVKKAIWGKVFSNDKKLSNKVENIIAGSLIKSHNFEKEKNLLLVVSPKRICTALDQITSICEEQKITKTPISGIILTGDGRHIQDSFTDIRCKKYIQDHQIPVISTKLDTYGSVVKISRIDVKININTPWKTKRAIELVEKNVDLNAIIQGVPTRVFEH